MSRRNKKRGSKNPTETQKVLLATAIIQLVTAAITLITLIVKLLE